MKGVVGDCEKEADDVEDEGEGEESGISFKTRTNFRVLYYCQRRTREVVSTSIVSRM